MYRCSTPEGRASISSPSKYLDHILMSYNSCFINFFLRPLLLGAPLVNVGTISKAAPIRVGHTKKFINKELNFIYDFGK